jgi:DnaJ homolog subfamily A member 2
LSQTYHPDKNPPEMKDECTKKFQEINEAKSILMDENRRREYDQVGMETTKNEGGGGFNPFAQFFQSFNININGMKANMKREPEPKVLKISVGLDEIYNCVEKTIKYERKLECTQCGLSECGNCKGSGSRMFMRQMGPMIQQFNGPCEYCQGKGQISKNKDCGGCKGSGFKKVEESFQFRLDKSMNPGHFTKFYNKGDYNKSDFVLVIKEIKNGKFKRDGNNLFTEIDIDLIEALFGFKRQIIHMDNREIDVVKEGESKIGEIIKISGEGMNGGDLYVRLNISLNCDREKLKSLL